MTNYSEFENVTFEFQNSSIAEIVEQNGDSFKLKGIDVGTTKIYYYADNAEQPYSNVTIGERERVIEYERLTESYSLYNTGDWIDFIKITNYDELYQFFILFKGILIEKYEIFEDGVIRILMDENTRGDGKFTMASRFSPVLTTGRFKFVSQPVLITDESLNPLTLEYEISKRYNFDIRGSELNGLKCEITLGKNLIDVFWSAWEGYVKIKPLKVGKAQIVINADYFYEPYILNIEVVDNIPES